MKSSKRHSDYCRNLVIAGRPHVAFCMPDECPICLAYQRGQENADHGDCICTQVEGQFWQDGSLRWIYVDGVKFVPAAARGDGAE